MKHTKINQNSEQKSNQKASPASHQDIQQRDNALRAAAEERQRV